MIEKKYFNYTFKGYYLRASYLNTFLVAVLVPIFLVTGLWQLNKAQEKQKILNHFDINATQPKLKLAEIPKPITPYFNYHTIEEEGHYDEGHQFLVESKRVKGKSGYEVITPFFVESSGKINLVDRVWVP